MLLEIRDGTVSRGGKTVLERFSFDIKGTEHAAIVGRNGAGKTTLLEVIAGTRELDADEKNPGSGLFRSRAFTVGMLPRASGLRKKTNRRSWVHFPGENRSRLR